MIVRYLNGTEAEVHISLDKYKNIRFNIIETTGAKTRDELKQVTRNNLKDAEIIKASEQEKKLLKRFGYLLKGL